MKYSEFENELDRTYWERTQLLVALSKIYPSYLARHDSEDKEWDIEWMNILVIEIPNKVKTVAGDFHHMMPESMWFKVEGKQCSWHIKADQLGYFKHLPYKMDYKWDTHSTDLKYERLSKVCDEEKKSFWNKLADLIK